MTANQKKYQHIPRKRFGQNFLQDQFIIDNIINAIMIHPDDTVVEIGPGLGALTKPILKRLNTLHVIEIDRDIVHKLEKFTENKKIIIHQHDALSFDFNTIKGKKRIIGNLPYNISTPLLFHLAYFHTSIEDMHLMLQKEVVNRITAKPGISDYGRLSVMLQYLFETKALFSVPATAFWPIPKVESAIIRIIPSPGRYGFVADSKIFSNLVFKAFNHRRKTLKNNLKDVISEEEFYDLGIPADYRAENITVEQYIKMANLISAKNNKS